jgi:hypothetical protein
MKYFISYRHTGEDPKLLEQVLVPVRDAFCARGDEIYCVYFQGKELKSGDYTPRDILEHAFVKIGEIGHLFVLQHSNNRSEGMLMEVGFCRGKNIPITLARQQDVTDTFLPTMANRTFDYSDVDDLCKKIAQL